jgi:hypothetical protein
MDLLEKIITLVPAGAPVTRRGPGVVEINWEDSRGNDERSQIAILRLLGDSCDQIIASLDSGALGDCPAPWSPTRLLSRKSHPLTRVHISPRNAARLPEISKYLFGGSGALIGGALLGWSDRDAPDEGTIEWHFRWWGGRDLGNIEQEAKRLGASVMIVVVDDNMAWLVCAPDHQQYGVRTGTPR